MFAPRVEYTEDRLSMLIQTQRTKSACTAVRAQEAAAVVVVPGAVAVVRVCT